MKKLSSLILIILLFACGGTKKEIDYSQLTDAELLQLANSRYENGEYEKALADYERLLLDFPTSNLHIEAQLKMSDIHGKMENFEEQMNTLHRLVKENIIPEYIPRIYVQIGKFYEQAAQFNPGNITSDSVDYRKAIDYYRRALNYPDSDDAQAKAHSIYRRALVEAKIGQIEQAISNYRMVTNMYPASEFSILAQMKLKDPNNTTELMTTDSALTVYREQLGLVAPERIEEESESDTVPVEEMINEDEGNLDSTIDMMEENQEEQTEETEESEPPQN